MKTSLPLFGAPKVKTGTNIQSIADIDYTQCNNNKKKHIAILYSFHVFYIIFPTAIESSGLSLKHDLHDRI